MTSRGPPLLAGRVAIVVGGGERAVGIDVVAEDAAVERS